MSEDKAKTTTGHWRFGLVESLSVLACVLVLGLAVRPSIDSVGLADVVDRNATALFGETAGWDWFADDVNARTVETLAARSATERRTSTVNGALLSEAGSTVVTAMASDYSPRPNGEVRVQ